MVKRLLIVYGKNSAEILSRQSALGSYIYCLADLLEENGYSVFINGTAVKALSPKSTVTTNDKNKSSLKKLIPGFVKRIMKDLRLFRNLERLKKAIIEKQQYDAVIEFYSYGSSIGYDISTEKNIPLLLIYDSPIREEYFIFNNSNPFFSGIINRREKKTLLKAATTVVYSHPVKKYIEQLAGKKLTTAIHQNVDFSRFDFVENRQFGDIITIGFIGSFLKWHRVDLLIDAFIRLKKAGYAVQLFLLGMGEEFENIREKVAASGYSSSITLPGYVDGETLLNYKKQIDIGVMPGSNWYGAPNKIFEYGAAGMAVTAPATPTIEALFGNGKELLLFENNSAEGLYTSLERYCSDKALMQRLALNLQQKIRSDYSKNNTFEFYDDLIKKIA